MSSGNKGAGGMLLAEGTASSKAWRQRPACHAGSCEWCAARVEREWGWGEQGGAKGRRWVMRRVPGVLTWENWEDGAAITAMGTEEKGQTWGTC